MSESDFLRQDDEKKNKKKQSPSPVDDRPVVPAPSEAMLNSKYILVSTKTVRQG